MNKPFIAPSLLSADFGNLERDIQMINESAAAWFHVDVMDGVFVPNISFGFPVIKPMKKYATKPLDVHLMIEHPENYVQQFADAGANHLTFHIENKTNPVALLQKIRSLKMKAGLAISPGTNVTNLTEAIIHCDLIILMSVKPGFGGQKFIPETYDKLRELKALIQKANPACLIEVDGGVDLQNAPELIRHGADALVAGNTVFASADPKATIEALRKS